MVKASEASASQIWALFSVDNLHDQPPNNLVAWWLEKPSLETLFKTLSVKMDVDEHVVGVVNIWQGNESRAGYSDTVFRLELIDEGSQL
jgi:hypothetical protein